MKVRWLVAAALLVVSSLSSLQAQEPTPAAANRSQRIQLATNQVQTTPEMWFYEQERARYDSPQEAVRRKAEYAAMQRQWRITMMKAQGLSKLRPSVSPTPMWGTYLETQNPYKWGYGNGVMAVFAPDQDPLARSH